MRNQSACRTFPLSESITAGPFCTSILFGLGLFSAASLCSAQTATTETQMLDLPRQSQHALITQRIGVTDITINYHRPLAEGRELWGKLVPYGRVWRAGANENTTIAFSDPVTVEGMALANGTYGLHMIPGESEWTVIFSTNSTSWGSFSYDQAEDALRVKVKPRSSEPHNALTYDFDDLRPDSAVITMRWGNIAVPFKISMNVNEVTVASIRKQLRGLSQYYWDSWDDAAGYFLANGIHLEEALKDEERSIQIEARYDNLLNKSRILDALGRSAEAATCRTQAFEKATAVQLYTYARQLQNAKKADEAFAIFRTNAKKFPQHWTSHLGMARVYSGQGEFESAIKELKAAMPDVPQGNRAAVEGYLARLEAKEDFNR